MTDTQFQAALDVQEQIARIDRELATHDSLRQQIYLEPRKFWTSAIIAAAALLGAGAAIGGLLVTLALHR